MEDASSLIERAAVLIVDDSPNDLAVMSEILNDVYRVKITNSGMTI